MDTRALYREMSDYHQWRQLLGGRLTGFENWIQAHGLVSQEVRNCIAGARRLLSGDSFTLACVGEFSRGKTELINALLLGHSQSFPGSQRILPSRPGRTTMCPAEIYCDPQNPNSVRLLPIETRRSKTNLAQFKRIPEKWVRLDFDPESPEQLRAAIDQVAANRWVSPDEAEALGFAEREWGERDGEGRVAIPNWRHALISLDHPLLRRGLKILDTPGLNALGNEPELALRVLPQAQVVIFMLAADAGVTASDMALWREHIEDLAESRGTVVLTLLNKVDSLWDDLGAGAQAEHAVRSVQALSARQLGLRSEQVLPLSAKQALLAQARNQPELLARSGFAQLERALASSLAQSRAQLSQHRLIADSETMIRNTRTSLTGRLADAQKELMLVRTNRTGDQADPLAMQRETIRQSHRQYHKQALSLRTSQMLLEKQRPALVYCVQPQRLRQEIEKTRQNLAHSWTSLGLSRAMAQLFEWLDSQVNHLEEEVERANRVVTSIYQRPEHQAGQARPLKPHKLDIRAERQALRQLHRRADHFRASLGSLLRFKSELIQRFIDTLVSEAQALWQALNQELEDWLQQALAPLLQHNQYQRQLLEQHMLRLTRMRHQQQGRSEQVQALRVNIRHMREALDELEPMCREEPSFPAPIQNAAVVSLDQVRRTQA